MARTKKKRTKRYQGADAAVTGPVIKRYEAIERTRFGQWWVDHKLRIRIFGVLALIIGVLTLLITGITGLFR